MRARLLLRPFHTARRIAYVLYVRRHPNEPWLAPPAVAYLDRELPRDGAGLEWGSGRSTSWFGERLARLVSVEMNADWYETVKRKVADMPSVDLRYVAIEHPEHEPTRPHYDLVPKYVSVADESEPASLDFVLVDGHYRQACVLAALPKLRPGGLLVVDNTDWLPDREWGVPDGWQRVHRSSNVVTVTTIWRKPG
ncbi:MAG: class I SAM-dependent methyltransferase [Actinomycetota bacterium]|nr:class I SAM-dependent methyltransferase [Actinomycetota bacterium]